MAKNVTDDPMKNVNAATDFVQKYTEALVITAAMDFFGMEEVDSTPTVNKFEDGNRGKYVHQKLGQLVDRYAIPDDSECSSKHKCPLCSQEYASVGNVKKHIEKDHGPGKVTEADVPSNEDGVYNYSCNMLSLCLIALNFTDARQMADGERLMMLIRYMLLFFKITGKRNYAFHSLRLLAQVNVLLSPRQAYNLVHNRFVNTHKNNPKSNIEVDRVNEHYNREYKDNYRGLHGKATPASIDRVSRSARKVTAALTSFDKANNIKPRSRSHTSHDHTEDVKVLVKRMSEEHIFQNKGNRFHNSFPGMKKNFMSMVDHSGFNRWIRDAFKLESRKGIWQE